MRGAVRILLLLVGLGLGLGARAESEKAGSLIDQVWAGHPVGFAMLVERGHVFVAYYDAERRITVAARAPDEPHWRKVTLPGVWNAAKRRASNVLGWDSHNSLVLAADRDGCLHLAGNLHADPLVYYRTARSLEIESFERLDRMTGEREERCTYPRFFRHASGDLLFSYRDGSSGNASDLINRYDVSTRTWHRLLPTALFDGEGKRSAYALAPLLGPDGRFHLLWMWRDTPDAATNQQLSYARSADLLHWEDGQGRPLALPLTFGRGDIIDAAPPGEGLINTTYTLGFDAQQRPVALYHRYDGNGRSQIFAARPMGATWERRAVTAWDFRWAFGGTGTLLVDVYLHPTRQGRDGSLLVPVSGRAVPGGQLRLDPQTLALQEILPPEKSPLPDELMRAHATEAELEVRTLVVHADGKRYVLRWETLPSNRDRPRDEVPAPTELRLFEFPSDPS
ncbi:MAG TPA: BNR repeat-containing protein [Acidobacteriota bacterium]|nr:BNR repeat-containing protein [Acidobacteriota bacterium]